ncbi:lipoprotein-releasing ABC transporter permease subunit LolE [Celerinatantimonas yamalensis]|uniref:Lipoprotein-releasing ABC transporter permease subunit LolE n=1 Tax=Celerinatantimonas yamalensis TaxID=559956 RepID=A0ABW9G399_9GAMM
MMRFLALFIGLRYHRFGHRRGLVAFISRSSTIGIALGVAVLIIGLSVMNGFQKELNDRFLSVVSQGELPAVQPPLKQASKLATIARNTPNVLGAAPYISMNGLLAHDGHLSAVGIRGIEPELQLQVTNLRPFVQPNAWRQLAEAKPGLVLGAQIAAKLDVHAGDVVTLMLPAKNQTRSLQAPRRVRMPVLGTFQIGGQLDGQLAFMALHQAQLLNGWKHDEVTGISVKVTDPLRATHIVRQVGLQYPQLVYVQSWTQQYGYLYQDIQMVRTIMYAIMLLIVAVASFNIISTLILAVADKRKDLAILKTLGAQDGLLIRAFMVYGAYNAIVGCFWGIVFGVLGSWWLPDVVAFIERITGRRLLSPDVYFVDFLPSQLDWTNVALVSVTAAGIGLLATIWPASQARHIQPAEELSN